jgi:hypothetical protein
MQHVITRYSHIVWSLNLEALPLIRNLCVLPSWREIFSPILAGASLRLGDNVTQQKFHEVGQGWLAKAEVAHWRRAVLSAVHRHYVGHHQPEEDYWVWASAASGVETTPSL